MSLLDVEEVVVVAKASGEFRWFKSDRDLWVLDLDKWTKDFVDAGYDIPESDPSERFGIPVVNDQTIASFLSAMGQYEVEKLTLGKQLADRFDKAKSWWDVGDLFPIMFLDADRRHVAAFYSSGTPMERYIPDGWTSEFEDFATKYGDEDFPQAEKFWIQDGIDMLKILNERGEQLSQQ